MKKGSKKVLLSGLNPINTTHSLPGGKLGKVVVGISAALAALLTFALFFVNSPTGQNVMVRHILTSNIKGVKNITNHGTYTVKSTHYSVASYLRDGKYYASTIDTGKGKVVEEMPINNDIQIDNPLVKIQLLHKAWSLEGSQVVKDLKKISVDKEKGIIQLNSHKYQVDVQNGQLYGWVDLKNNETVRLSEYDNQILQQRGVKRVLERKGINPNASVITGINFDENAKTLDIFIFADTGGNYRITTNEKEQVRLHLLLEGEFGK